MNVAECFSPETHHARPECARVPIQLLIGPKPRPALPPGPQGYRGLVLAFIRASDHRVGMTEIAQGCGLTLMRASKPLTDLVKKGLIVRSGRHGRYKYEKK